MNGFSAELRKLWTVRTSWVLTVLGWALVTLFALAGVASGAFGPFGGSDREIADTLRQTANPIIVLIVALLAMTTEFRHRTIGRTLQLIPSRSRVLALKIAAAVAYALVFFATSVVIAAVVLMVAAARNGVSLSPSGDTVEALWQGVAGLTMTASLGVAVGALIRSQVVAVTVSLVWLFVVENLASALAPHIGRWLPFQALNAVFLTEEVSVDMPAGFAGPLSRPVALATFLGYVAVGTLVAAVLMRTRDV